MTTAKATTKTPKSPKNKIKSSILPWRFGLFLLLLASMAGFALILPWQQAIMAGFDLAALGFFVTLPPLFACDTATMREHSKENEANRFVALVITTIVMLAVLVSVATVLAGKGRESPLDIAFIVSTLAAAWLFSNTVFALHYAHLFYVADQHGNKAGAKAAKDCGGVDFPLTSEPEYWDFIYFAFTLGMTFQTSDVEITLVHWRRVVTFHCLAAFVFNLGVLAFSINVLSGG
jgi:uncharacterized membrane protein